MRHLPIVVLAVGAVLVAAGVHTASLTVGLVAAGHLVIGLFLVGIRRVVDRSRTVAR